MLLKYCFYKCVSADRWNANWLELSPWCLTFSDFIVCNRSVTDWTLSWSSIQWICLWQYLALDWRQNSCPGTTLIFLLFSCWAIWRVITCLPYLCDNVSSILHNIYFSSSQKHYQTLVHNITYVHSFLLHIQKSCTPQIRVCLISFKVI